MWPPRNWGHVTEGGGGNSGAPGAPSCAHAVSQVRGEPAASPGWAGTHPWPSGASPGIGAEDRQTQWGSCSVQRGSGDAHQAPVPSAGCPSLLEDAPKPRLPGLPRGPCCRRGWHPPPQN